MKRHILILASLALLIAGAAFAQSTLNTTAPGPTQQLEPGQTNNNLPNPGNPVPARPNQNQPVTEQGTVTGTATESLQGNQGANTTGNTTGTMAPETEQGEGMDVDVDTGSRAEGAVDVDVTSTTDADTDASGSGVQTTGQYDSDTDALPSTASELPSVALMGLLFLGAAFALRVYAKRNA